MSGEDGRIKNDAAALDDEAERLAHVGDTVIVQDAPAPGVDEPKQQQSIFTAQQEVGAMLEMALTALAPIWPGLRAIYTPSACDQLAEAGAALLEKYDVTVSDLFVRFKEEFNFAVVALPLVLETLRAARAGRLKSNLKSVKGGDNVTGMRPEYGPVVDPDEPKPPPAA